MNPDIGHDSPHPTPRALEAAFAAELAAVRPGLSGAYADALPPARAAVLGRLWRALLYEPLPGVAVRDGRRGSAGLRDGRVLSGPPRLPHDLGTPGDRPTVRLDGRAYAHPAELLTAIGMPGAAALTAELDHSVASLALSLAGAADAEVSGTDAADRSLAYFEQSVIDGHPYHPCCRSRPGFSVADQLAYGPEHRPVVGVDLVAVPADRCRVAGPWPAWLRDGDRLLLPVHPWQRRQVLPGLGHPPFAVGAIRARPLMTVRTFAPLAGGPHLKTALTMRMTSQVRDISAGAVTNSTPLSALLSDVVGRLDGRLGIARNLAAACAVVDGTPSPDLAALLRESPADAARLRAGETVLPVAALTARPADGGPPLIRSLLAAAGAGRNTVDWLASFARSVLPPTLRLLSWGVALAAHGQNLLVVLDEEARPCRFVYRDLADIRLSPARLAHHGFTVPPLGNKVISDDPAVLRGRLFGHLIGTTLSSLVSALAEGDRNTETRLWAAVAAEARRAYDDLPATGENRADRAALFGAELPVKALTLMRLEGAPPGDLWAPLPNPLA
ncbi:IucA/IucC family protein [Streptomyces celluloflavus]|uniref:IucA/IucC family protein n=1 Tax=Streptomyces celluloflavus TaxID=58344 RepID=UPI0036D95DC3